MIKLDGIPIYTYLQQKYALNSCSVRTNQTREEACQHRALRACAPWSHTCNSYLSRIHADHSHSPSTQLSLSRAFEGMERGQTTPRGQHTARRDGLPRRGMRAAAASTWTARRHTSALETRCGPLPSIMLHRLHPRRAHHRHHESHGDKRVASNQARDGAIHAPCFRTRAEPSHMPPPLSSPHHHLA